MNRLKACSQFEGMERLKCVDELLQEVAPDPHSIKGRTGSSARRPRRWTIRPQIAALTIARRHPRRRPSSLAIRCRARRTELTISRLAPGKPAVDDEVKVVYGSTKSRLLNSAGKPRKWGEVSPFQATVVRFLRSMPDSGQILVKVYAGKSPPYESTFQLAGLDPVRRKIAAACTGPPLIDAHTKTSAGVRILSYYRDY